MGKMEKSLSCNSSILSVFPHLLQTFPEMYSYTCSPMGTETGGNCIYSSNLVAGLFLSSWASWHYCATCSVVPT